MRLRLQIFRNELPVVKLLWETTEHLKPGTDHIVSNLLSSINEVFPLDGSTWGLDDYVVELDGYELLHFQDLSSVFKHDDTVIVRPLSNSEVKRRRISGRTQISIGGRKLLDGTPFGRPYIRPARDRPQLLIPSAKRTKSGTGVETSTLQLHGMGEDGDGEDDDDYEPVDTEAADEEGDDDMDVEDTIAEPDTANRRTIVRFVPVKANDDSGESDDSSFQASDSESGSESDSESDSQSDPESDAESTASSQEGGVVLSPKATNRPEKPLTNKNKPEELDAELSAHSSSDPSSGKPEEAEETQDGEPEMRPSNGKRPVNPQKTPPSNTKPTSTVKGPGTAPGTVPYEASTGTRSRNRRKKIMLQKERNLLNQLQAQGILTGYTRLRFKEFLSKNSLNISTPPDVIKRHLEEPQKADQTTIEVGILKGGGDPPAGEEPKSKKEVGETPHTAYEARGPTTIKEAPIKKRDRKAYKAAVQAGLAQPGNIRQWLRDQNVPPDATLPESSKSTTNGQERLILPPTSHLSKQDLGSSPYSIKNKGWKQFRNKPASRTIYDVDGNSIAVDIRPGITTTPMLDQEAVPEAPGPSSWRSKIYLSAVECEQKNVVLPTPDFPFRHQQLQEDNVSTNRGKKRKRIKNRQEINTEYERCQEPQGTEPINPSTFDEGPPNKNTTSGNMTEEDLPILPADMSSLSPLTLPLLRGTIIAFKHFSLGPQYMPVITNYRTATVENVHTDVQGGPLVELRLAIRDRPQVRYDEETGQKVLGKLDMPGFEGEESGYLDLNFGELLEAKVVQLPEGGVEAEVPRIRHDGNNHDNSYNPDELDYGEDIHMGETNNSIPATKSSKPCFSQQNGGDARDEAPALAKKLEPEKQNNMNEEPQDVSMQAWEDETFGTLEQEDDIDEMEERPCTPPVPISPVAENNVPLLEQEIESAIHAPSPELAIERDGSPLRPKESTIPKTSSKAKVTPSLKSRKLPSNRPSSPILGSPSSPSSALEFPPAQEKSPKLKSKFDCPTDSEGELPSLETWFSQQTQIKAELKGDANSPSLPPLPDFSPFSVRGQEEDISQGQIMAEASATKRTAGKNTPAKRKGRRPPQVIDLTSSSPEREPPLPSKGNKVSSNISVWKDIVEYNLAGLAKHAKRY